MKHFVGIVSWATMLAIILVGARPNHADVGLPWSCKFGPKSSFEKSGPVELRLEFTPTVETVQLTFVQLTFTVTTSENLEYSGETFWSIQLEKGQTYSKLFQVTVPPNDTSMIEVEIKGLHVWCRAPAYFVTTKGEAKHYKGNPKNYLPFPDPEKTPRIHIGIQDEVRVPVIHDTTKTYIKDEAGNWVVMEEPPPPPPMRPRTPMTLDSLHKLEQEPLVGVQSQVVRIGEQVYERKEGEHKFRLLEPITDFEQHHREIAARQRQGKPPARYDVVLDLRNPEEFALVEKIVDSLIPMEKDGFYRTVTSKESLGRIEKMGIKWSRYPRYPGERETRPRPEPPKKETGEVGSTDSDGKSGRAEQIFFEGFEGAPPPSGP